MKYKILSIFFLLTTFAFTQTSQSLLGIYTSGGTATFQNPNLATTVSFYEQISGLPVSSTIIITGCSSGGSCTVIDTYTGNATITRAPSISQQYANFVVIASWIGGASQVSVSITATLTGGTGSTPVPYTTTVSVVYFSGAPTETCTSNQFALNTSNGNLYDCLNGVWNQVGGVGGAFGPVSGTANQIDVVTGTTTPLLSIDPIFIFPGSAQSTGLTINGILNPAGTPTGTPSGTGGTMGASTFNYAQIVAVDSAGYTTGPGTTSAAVTTTGSIASIAWSWTAVTGAASYQIWVCTGSSCTLANYFTSATNSFTQIAPASSGTGGTLPSGNSSGTLNFTGSSVAKLRVGSTNRQVVGYTKQLSTTTATAVTIASLNVAADSSAGIVLRYSVIVKDTTNHKNCIATGVLTAVAENSASTIVASVDATTGIGQIIACTSGDTLAVTFAITNANPAVLTVTPAYTTIAPTAAYIIYSYDDLSDASTT